jgi:sodium-dependent dicarboxylate transporter 2/3/5
MRALLYTCIATVLSFSVAVLLPAEQEVRKGVAILTFAGVLWITEGLPLPVTSVFIPVLACTLGVLNTKSAFASFAHPIIFLFFGGFALATALTKYNLDRLLAFKIVYASGGSLLLTCLMLFSATAFVSMWISNTSTTAMMLPLAIGIANAVKADSRLRTFLLLGIAYSASVGGIGTVVGSPPNGITAGNLGIGFTDWLKFGIPAVLILLPLLFVLLYLYFKPSLEGVVLFEKTTTRFGRKEIGVLAVFAVTVLLWFFSKKVSAFLGVGKYFDALVAVFAVFLLFLFKLVSWDEINRGTDWGTLYLFGGGLTLSQVLKTTGASKFIASAFAENVSGLSAFLIVLSVTTFMIFMTELMSNTATAAIFVPILMSMATQMGYPPYEFAVPAGIAASCAFMLPVATPPNAIVYGTGQVKQKDMMRVGIILNLCFSVVITVIALLVSRAGYLPL